MYLKSIEVQGFKSFAHKTKFDFHNGITAIVGPNGSGKSNVADAVRWVFGEQSAKQLRGSNMQDIIFAGTQQRRPQSFAAVSLTLDNSDHSLSIDYDEVTVTRKVYRSGESEYLINNNNCRLKDILELFYDTGIGTEGYSIIGQGQVDKIISGRMDERRELFDEACGIVKSKKRKTAAQRKLEHEQANMLRISDIVSELERQAGPLKRQSETAKEYLRLRDELRVYDINAFIIDHERYLKQLSETNSALELTLKDLAEKKAQEDSLKASFSTLEEELEGLNSRLEEARIRVNEATEEKTSLEGRIGITEETLRSAAQELSRLQERIAAIDTEVSLREADITSDDAALASGKEEEEAAEGKLSERLSAQTAMQEKISLYKKSAEENQQGLIDLLTEKNEASSTLSSLNTLIEQENSRLKETEEQAEALAKEREEKDQALTSLNEEKKALETELAEKQEALEEARKELEDAENDHEELRQRIYELNQRFQINKSRYETLRNVQEQYEGFNNAVRRIMEVKNRYPGVCGVVSDLLEADKKFRTAIEAALGGNYQNIVVETEGTAKQLVAFLKENRAGRATFLPLDAIRSTGRLSDERILQEEGVYGTADTLVHADRKYDPVVKYLLERIVVVEDIDRATALARKYRYSMRMVTLEGEILAVGGSITGGSFKNNNHYLGRTEELKNLLSTNEQLKKDIAESERQLNLKKQLKESLNLEHSDLQDEAAEINLKLTEKRSQTEHTRSLIAALDQEARDLFLRKKELTEAINEASGRKASIEEAMQNLEQMNENSDSSRTEIAGLLQESEAELEELQKATEEVRLKLSQIRQRQEFLASDKDRLSKEIERLKEEKAQILAGNEESEAIKEDREKELENLRKALTKKTSDLAELTETHAGLLESREALTSRQKAYFDERDSLSNILTDLNREEIRLEGQKEKTEERLDDLVNYLWTEYELTPSEAEKFKDETLDNPSRIRRHAQELKTEIKKLGNVNVNAIEQYNEVSERYEFMTAQYNDLKKAEEDLLDIIKDLDDGMRKQFTEQFALICDEYDKVFKELFGGGQGTLEMKEGDVLDADINIISQPPGKKLQNMMQLSGGEKALSAIALIFAIQNLKPSPFCLLDEIEAALDDSNVGRFTGYLRKLTHSTQFIVITHRRGTMVAADRLYGITMQEKGVSTLISVSLVEQELDN